MLGMPIMSGVLGLALMAGVTGCQSQGQAKAAPGTPPAVMCDKCKTTWVTTPKQQGKVTTYSPTRVMTCPDCKSAAVNFFSTGKLEHTCKTCGGNLEPCASH